MHNKKATYLLTVMSFDRGWPLNCPTKQINNRVWTNRRKPKRHQLFNLPLHQMSWIHRQLGLAHNLYECESCHWIALYLLFPWSRIRVPELVLVALYLSSWVKFMLVIIFSPALTARALSENWRFWRGLITLDQNFRFKFFGSNPGSLNRVPASAKVKMGK